MKKRILLLSTVLISGLSLNNALAQISYAWAKKNTGAQKERVLGNFGGTKGLNYNTGYFEGTVDFDPGSATLNLTSAGNTDIYIQKLDPNGNLLWVRRMGGTGADAGVSVTQDWSKNVYVTGYFSETADLNPHASFTQNVTSVGGQDIFITKLDSNGTFIWSKVISGLYKENPFDIKVDMSYNVLVCGSFQGTTDFDPNSGVSTLSSTMTGGNYTNDGFVVKLNALGNYIWAKQFAGPNEVSLTSIDLWNENNFYVSGYFKETVDANPNSGVQTLTSAGGLDFFVLRINPNGELIWAKQTGGAGDDIATAIAVDIYGSVYATGNYVTWSYTTQSFTPVDFNPNAGTDMKAGTGINNLFVQKIKKDGSYDWTYTASTMTGNQNKMESESAMTFSGQLQGHGIAIDICDNIFVTGVINGRADMDPGNGITMVSNGTGTVGTFYMFLLKLKVDQTFLGAIGVGATGNTVWPTTVGVDYFGNPYVGGYFTKNIDFDPSTNVNLLTSALTTGSTTVYSQDAFIVKYNSSLFGSGGGGSITGTSPAGSGTSRLGNEVDVTSSVNPVELQFYPNPARAFLNIETPETGTLEIYSIAGIKVSSEIISSGLTQKNLSQLQSGTYILRFTSPSGVSNHPIVVGE